MSPRLPFLLALLLASGCTTDTIHGGEDIHGTDEEQGTPRVLLPEDSYDFGDVAYGQSVTGQVAVENVGDGVLSLLSITATAPFSTAYTSTVQVSPGSSINLTVRFQPTEYQDYTGTLTITCDDPDNPELTVALSGGVITDEDGDGYDSEAAGGDDCDDSDPTIHPGAVEEYYDGVDQDCAGDDDYDQDGDGYQHIAHNEDPAMGGGDCNDANPDIHPGAEDVWYDGLDSNCDGLDDWDADGDGEETTIGNHGYDCDDSDPDVNMMAEEVFDGRDNDCDGAVDYKADGTLAELVIEGTSGSERVGWALSIGDMDGDGRAELAVGAPYYGTDTTGGVFVFYGGSLPGGDVTVEDADAWLQGTSGGDLLGTSVAFPGDFDGDGVAELAFGAPGIDGSNGAVYLVNGAEWSGLAPLGDTVADELVHVAIHGEDAMELGTGISDDVDLDGDGLADLVVGYSPASGEGIGLVYGNADLTGSVDANLVQARYELGNSDALFPRNLPHGEDLDGDGYQDLLLCSGSSDYAASNGGVVFVLWGQAERYNDLDMSLADVATAVAYGAWADRELGRVCAPQPDMDGDGAGELWIWSDDEANLYLFHGGPELRGEGVLQTSEADVTYLASDSVPSAVSLKPVGDWDGDGIWDVGLSLGSSSSTAGYFWVYSSQVNEGYYDADDDVLARVQGDEDEGSSSYGNGISGLGGDIDGDGLDDYAVGDYGWDDPSGGGSEQGAVFVYYQY